MKLSKFSCESLDLGLLCLLEFDSHYQRSSRFSLVRILCSARLRCCSLTHTLLQEAEMTPSPDYGASYKVTLFNCEACTASQERLCLISLLAVQVDLIDMCLTANVCCRVLESSKTRQVQSGIVGFGRVSSTEKGSAKCKLASRSTLQRSLIFPMFRSLPIMLPRFP